MVTKGKTFLVASVGLIALVVLGGFVFGFENHVRWNPMLEECVYFYQVDDNANRHCYVEENNCEGKTLNIDKNVDTDSCYYTPRKYLPATDCEEFIEGDLIKLNYEGSDPDSDVGPAGELIYTVGEPFDSEKSWQTERGDAGEYKVMVKVSDGQYEDQAEVCFRILSGNDVPVLTVDDVTADEGETVKLKPRCEDPDGDAVKLLYSGDMTSKTWTTTYADAGDYTVTVECTDGELSDTEKVTVTIVNVDRKPTLSVNDVTVRETDTVRIKPSCDDPEGVDVELSYSGDMTSDSWRTGYDDAGVYAVKVTCDDGENTVSEDVKVTVEDFNRPPLITAAVTLG